ELLFAEMIVFLLLWLWDDYAAKLVTLIVVCISAAILLIALIMEGIERSKVPKFYYVAMGITVVAPLVVMGIFLLL
ncbi:MAG: hypothetical protein AAFV80_21345, partial [Bacteroidota bacterium]